MGQILEFKCVDCGHKFSFRLGHGKLTHTKHYEETVEKVKRGEFGLIPQTLLLENKKASVFIRDRIYICKECGNQVALDEINIIVNREVVFQVKQYCNKCGAEMTVADKSINKIKCEKCKSEKLLENVILFD